MTMIDSIIEQQDAEIESLRSRVAHTERKWADAESAKAAADADLAVLQGRLAETDERHSRYVKAVGELAGKVADLEAALAYAASTGDECAIEVEALVKYLRAHMAPDRPCKRSEQDIACGQAAAEIESLRSRLAGMEGLYVQACEQRDDANALLREARNDYAHAMNDAQIAAAVGCNLIEHGVKLSAWLGKIARIDAHLARKP
jgi:DNA repair exonuclease SbcCD ATPase subunit